jgi:hypothetical protein
LADPIVGLEAGIVFAGMERWCTGVRVWSNAARPLVVVAYIVEELAASVPVEGHLDMAVMFGSCSSS